MQEFKLQVPQLAAALLELIRRERRANPIFIKAFEGFAALCRAAINPNLAEQALEEMLIQHILTERIFRRVFDNPDFAERNIIAREIEQVVQALTSRHFSRHDFLKPLDRFYGAIEATAATIDDFSQKQAFLNTVYEKFFQGFSVKLADTHGIVYTPQPIVDFMARSVEEILQAEFGRSLSDKNVHILDPFVGTGNFIVRVMREIKRSRLPHKYDQELHCNEVMLLPYYIASMNIEHAYYELAGEYKPFEGVCLVDTFELAEQKQPGLFTQANTERVERQKQAPIFVILGNPPYNAGQINENDNNKNRKYPTLDRRVAETYGKASQATLLRKLSDPYVKAIRWASDRIGDEGMVAFVTNNSFVTEITFDGMRQCLERDFDEIYILDLGGNVRKNPKLSGTTHNVFGIQVGVSITVLVRKKTRSKQTKIHYASMGEDWRKEQKYDFLDAAGQASGVKWRTIKPDAKHNWLTEGMSKAFGTFLPLGTKETKRATGADASAIFKTFSLGVATNRDDWVYDFRSDGLEDKVKRLVQNYNSEVGRLARQPGDIDSLVNNDPSFVKWTDRLKEALLQGKPLAFEADKIRHSVYRPFAGQFLYFDHLLNQRRYRQPIIFPTPDAETENCAICASAAGNTKPFHCLMVNVIPDLHLTGDSQCFPLYTYDENGQRQDNITDWALGQFRARYAAAVGASRRLAPTKTDIFHYVYAILHHPAYRGKYAANLRRELPRIPFAPGASASLSTGFWAFAQAGAGLAQLHLGYEAQPEYPLTWIESPDAPLDYKVQKMRLSKDKTQLVYNSFLTLAGIPPLAFEYRLGNRSALDWVIDQYQLSADKRSGIVNDPNRPDDPQYIIHLIGKVITVSLETVKIVQSLPPLE